MANWKSISQLDEENDDICASRDFVNQNKLDSCANHCIEEGSSIMAGDGLPFCNSNGKNSIAIDFGESAELRDGSCKKPIQLTELQCVIGQKVKYLMAVLCGGTVVKISAPQSTGKTYRIVADADGFYFQENTSINSFSADIGSDAEFALGGKIVTASDGTQTMVLAKL